MRRIVTVLLLPFALVLASSAQTRTTACSAITTGDLGALNGWVPSPNDAWHQDISGAPVDPQSNTIMTTAGDLANRYLHPDFSNVVDGAAGIPYTVIDTSATSVPLVTIAPYDSDDSDNTLFPLPNNVAIEGNPGQCWGDQADHHAIVIDRATCADYEIYQANLCGGSWTSYGNVIWDFTLPNGEKRPYGMSSVDAAGLSVFEGLIRYDEIVAGSINHAIRFTAQHTKNDRDNGYFTAPAVHAAGNLWGVDNIMGMRIRLKADFDVSGFSSTNQIILNAMKKYGMILADNGGDLFFQGTPDPRWNDDDLSKLKAIPNTAFDVVKMAAVYDATTAPVGPAPQINSFTASVTNVVAGNPVVLTPDVLNGSYEFIDNAGFTRGPVTVHPTQTTTYTLWSRNEFQTSTASVTVNVSPNGTALSFTGLTNQVYGNPPFAVTTVSNSPGVVTYAVVSGPATMSGNVVTLTGTGTVTLLATQAASGSYAGTTATGTFTVSNSTPTLTFNPIPDQLYSVGSINVNATSNSPGAITYSVTSGPATISGNTVTFTGSGTVYLKASQPASNGFQAATASAIFTIFGSAATLRFNPIADQTLGAAPFAVSATSNSTGAITYSVVSGPATIAGSTVTLTGTGTVTLKAEQAAAGAFTAASAVVSFNVTGGAPTITFHVANQTYGAAPFAPTVTSNSTGAVTYSVVSGPATIAGGVVTLTGAGTVTLLASQAAAGAYAAGTATTSFTVSLQTPTLAFAAIANQTAGAAPFAVSASSNSTGAVTYAVVSGPATIAGNMVSVTGTGTVVLQATQAAAGGYSAGTASATFNVSAQTPTLAFAPIAAQTYGAAPFAVTATSNSTGTITYSVISGPGAVAGNIVTLTGTGTVTLQASQAAAGAFGAGTATVSFAVTGAGTSLAFAPIAAQTFGAAPFAVSATSNSPAAISYAVLSGPATIAGNVISLTGAGSVTVQASQPASGAYTAATTNATFQVNAAATNLTIAPIAPQTFGAAPFAVSSTSNSSAAISYAIVSGPATIAGNVVTLTGSGSVTLQASQPANAGYAAATATTSFVVSGGVPTLSIRPIGNQSFGTGPINLSAVSNSPGAITYTVISGPATVVGNILTLTGSGTVTIEATQAAAGGFAAATTTTTFSVSAGTPALTILTVPTQIFGTGPVAVAANSNSPGAITYSILSGPAIVTGNSVAFTGVGPVILQATQAATQNFAAASATTTFSVLSPSPNLAITPIPTQTYGSGPITVTATSSSSAPITYAVLAGPASITGTTLTLNGAGSVTVQATQPATANYQAGIATTTFTISPSSVVLSADFAMPRNITITIKQGSSGTASVPVSAVNGFSGIVTFTCSVPATMILGTCDPTNASLTSSTVASSTITVGTRGVQTAHDGGLSPRNAATGVALLAMMLPCGLPFFSRRKPNLRSFTLGVLLALTLAGATLTTTGCGTMILNAVTAPGTYVLPVKASAGNASHSMTLTVIVEAGN